MQIATAAHKTDFLRDLSFMSTPDAEFQEAASSYVDTDIRLKTLVTRGITQNDLTVIDGEIGPLLNELRQRVTLLGIASEQYILGAYWQEPDMAALGRVAASACARASDRVSSPPIS